LAQDDLSNAGNSNGACGCPREINYAPFREGPAIINPDNYGAPSLGVRDANPGTKWKRSVSRCETISIEPLSIGGEPAMEAWSVPGCDATLEGFGLCFWGEGDEGNAKSDNGRSENAFQSGSPQPMLVKRRDFLVHFSPRARRRLAAGPILLFVSLSLSSFASLLTCAHPTRRTHNRPQFHVCKGPVFEALAETKRI
jgi:hypothetical protein